MTSRASSRQPTRGGAQKNTRLLLLAVGLVVVVGGWWAWNTWRSTRDPAVDFLDTVGTQVGEIAPDFNVPTLAGETYSLSARQGKPTLIFFMAYWCGTCIPEARALAQLHREYGEQLNIIAIDLDPTSTPEALEQFKRASGSGDYTWAFDTGQEVATAYRVRSLDTTYILNATGHIMYKDEFPTPYETLKEALSGIGF